MSAIHPPSTVAGTYAQGGSAHCSLHGACQESGHTPKNALQDSAYDTKGTCWNSRCSVYPACLANGTITGCRKGGDPQEEAPGGLACSRRASHQLEARPTYSSHSGLLSSRLPLRYVAAGCVPH